MQRLLLILFAISVLNLSYFSTNSVAGAAPALAQVPRTGQIIMSLPNDDGNLRPGVAWPSPRFSDGNNGTVTDNLTGLVWLKDANCKETVGGIAKNSGALNWFDALTWSNKLASGFCTLSDGSKAGDWRLPNIVELESLLDLSKKNPAIPAPPAGGTYFSNVQSASDAASLYWSSSTPLKLNGAIPPAYDFAWYVDMRDGSVGNSKTTKVVPTPIGYVWPVRGGQIGIITVAPLSFSPVTQNGGSSTQIFTITNSGVANLVISDIAISGDPMFTLLKGDGSLGTCGSSKILTANNSCTFEVDFKPTAVATGITATLTITNSAMAAPLITIPLVGAGVENYLATVSVAGSGQVAITDNMSAQDTTCTSAADCSQSYQAGTVVTLLGTPFTGALFSGWSGDCSGSNDSCSFTMDKARSATATFTTLPADMSSNHFKVMRGGFGTAWTIAPNPGTNFSVPMTGSNFNIPSGNLYSYGNTVGQLNQYWVTPSVNKSAYGTISPSDVQTVAYKKKAIFTITPLPGYGINNIDQNCGPNFIDNRIAGQFTTDQVTFDCHVKANFSALTATSITSNAVPYGVYYQDITLTAKVAAVSGTPTGSIAFFDGSTSLGSVQLTAGSASIITKLSVGSHTITATYTSNDLTKFLNSTQTYNQIINPAPPVLTWLVPSVVPADTVLKDANAAGTQYVPVLTASAAVKGTFVYKYDGNNLITPGTTVLQPGLHQLTVHFTPDDTTNFAQANAGGALTVLFRSTPGAMLSTNLSKYYSSLQAAYDAALGGETIMTTSGTGKLIANKPISVTVKGGYDAGFQGASGVSVIGMIGSTPATVPGLTAGALILKSGRVKFEGISVMLP